jgi:predicted nucleic acid-binding protein
LVLVDSSIWIDFFGKKKTTTQDILEKILVNNNQACICGIILQEVLQGIRSDHEYEMVRERFSRLPFIYSNRRTYEMAASLYRILRKNGFTLPSADATLASIAIQYGLKLFTLDLEHFRAITKYSPLELF